MEKTVFGIEKMDCSCEENIIRMKLQDCPAVKGMDFDLAGRRLSVIHSGDLALIESEIASLKLGSSVISHEQADAPEREPGNDRLQKKMLWIVLWCNFFFFVAEIVAGLLSKSLGLVADSLDMLADAFVYGLSLFAVGAAVLKKKRVALVSGYFQIFLAVLGFAEVVRRFAGTGEVPDFRTMIAVSALALCVNVFCLLLLQKTRSTDAHIQASIIFSSNDVLINAGVIVAGIAVWLSGKPLPDLIVGSIIFIIVIRGTLRILRLAR